MRGAIDHIVLTVREPQASFALYDAFLRFLGYELATGTKGASNGCSKAKKARLRSAW